MLIQALLKVIESVEQISKTRNHYGKDADVKKQLNPSEFYPFPRTPHLWGSQGTDDDRRLSEDETNERLGKHLVIQEKLDGSNVGLWFGDDMNPVLQSRGHVLRGGDHPQYSVFHRWVWERTEVLKERLGDRYVLFGELLYARHRIFYGSLPDWLIFFDAMDRFTGDFLSPDRLMELVNGTGIVCVPVLGQEEGIRQMDILIRKYQGKSTFGPEEAEGIYVRHCVGGLTCLRAKWVRSSFHPGNPDWSRSLVVARNHLRSSGPL